MAGLCLVAQAWGFPAELHEEQKQVSLHSKCLPFTPRGTKMAAITEYLL